MTAEESLPAKFIRRVRKCKPKEASKSSNKRDKVSLPIGVHQEKLILCLNVTK